MTKVRGMYDQGTWERTLYSSPDIVARTISPRLFAITLVVPDPNSVLILCTNWSSSLWKLGSGDSEVGDICGSASSIERRTREEMDCSAGERLGLRNKSRITDVEGSISATEQDTGEKVYRLEQQAEHFYLRQ